MTSTRTISPSPRWTRAMERGLSAGRPTRQVDGSFRVPSLSHPGTYRTVTLDRSGHISGCDCPGWRSRQAPCRHAGAVAIALAYLMGAHIAPRQEPGPVDSNRSAKRLFREVA